ncbi:uncharacterized protein BDZ99DRAFT_392577 [Mytilinidion resinicola]|uniref:Tyrosine specific protein phosphatases domain-containing protein n=1 Tax=Mytilinidion resinicola TaxID=574789 RepID=A0A6A6YEQ9_9PEZI|nr:uncharacterized protein BDZ99DRAFT_392577 [Mytilinidion resinicola]KAF2807312.1 hypothetical protein BDZ99DRAFT_392577 [Mytilinidion resinicola]
MAAPNEFKLPVPPFFPVPHLNNFRDAALYNGGLVTSTGRKVRPGILFRSAEVSQLDQAGWAAVREAGVKTIFDLRSKPEVLKGWKGVDGMGVRDGWIKMLEAEGLERVWVPVFADDDYSPERLAERYMKYMGESVEGFAQAYRDILINGGPSYRKIFLYLASLPPPSARRNSLFLSNSPSAPIPPIAIKSEPLGALIHCTAGKDRTGVFFGLVLDLLGVPRDVIAAEYNLTELGLLSLQEKLVTRLTSSYGFKKYTLAQMAGDTMSRDELAAALAKQNEGADPGEVELPPDVVRKGREAALRMMGATKESMIAVLDMIDREWGSSEGYIRQVCGLGDEDIERLKSVLIVPGEKSSPL